MSLSASTLKKDTFYLVDGLVKMKFMGRDTGFPSILFLTPIGLAFYERTKTLDLCPEGTILRLSPDEVEDRVASYREE
ncbi:hypothetical protein C5B42_04795 [Candidatus Cerribacteria bacterium 'Amazon FNV 2010 28 9']|uniref:Uncharacterized protein n=1 Tax=Candidatus Cerribacteria bacterium 'Amazon FNV 2010 28 9' TaxID=2081795 RepID=A0A317JMW0_9BACT|nr:MAG: hypothetical protein C5B42_04795 [Candidatus Cerribacteria bacterium 'Amazon FNV 2010 28 9']